MINASRMLKQVSVSIRCVSGGGGWSLSAVHRTPFRSRLRSAIARFMPFKKLLLFLLLSQAVLCII